MEVFERRMREILSSRGMTITKLSEISGITKATIYCNMRGKNVPNAYTLSKYADALGVSMDWLYGRE